MPTPSGSPALGHRLRDPRGVSPSEQPLPHLLRRQRPSPQAMSVAVTRDSRRETEEGARGRQLSLPPRGRLRSPAGHPRPGPGPSQSHRALWFSDVSLRPSPLLRSPARVAHEPILRGEDEGAPGWTDSRRRLQTGRSAPRPSRTAGPDNVF